MSTSPPPPKPAPTPGSAALEGGRAATKRLGVRGRLLLAFVGISAFAVLAAAAALTSFGEVGRAFDRITHERVPAALASQQLSRQAERIAAAAPSLLSVNTAEEHQAVSEGLSADLAELNELLDALRSHGRQLQALSLIEGLVERTGANLLTLDTMTVNKLVLVERRRELLRDLRFAELATRRLLAPGLLVMDAKMSELAALLTPDAPVEGTAAVAELAEPIVALAPLQGIHAQILAVHDTLLKAAATETLAELDVMSVTLERALAQLKTAAADLEPDLARRLEPRFKALRTLAQGQESIVEARSRELRHLALMQELVDQSLEISRQLTAAVDQLVLAAKQDIQSADLEVQSVQQVGTAIMIGVVVLSLLCSFLIVWFYVGRSLIARLTALSDSMLAIAGGNLGAKIPEAGADEIGDMAQALTVFRDTAVEVRRTNLNEIREARQRLIEAIESISEGFSLYDDQDRLVLCNSRYRDLLYPGIADVVLPGTPFETILRTAAERGLIAGAQQNVEEWVSRRLGMHHNPIHSHLQRQSDGRWIQIDERKTDQGWTVAVYSDVTELKQHEQELSEKSRALEQISNQLAKFLPPQIYDSVFSGRHEVRVTSSRKKLTIFFSDVVGFTETTERLAPEALTQVLNHYLTEMSRIALRHGATVDKYMGDAILAFFGDPQSRGVKKDALACIKMAIEMRERLLDLEAVWRQSGIEKPLRVRMGVHSDFCTVGNFGSEDRMDYTIIGAAVNIASRLQSFATPGEILVSYETFALIRDQIHCEERGPVTVKGIAHPIATYQVVDSYEKLEGQRHRLMEEHANLHLELNLDAMTGQDREQAERILRRALDLLTQARKSASLKT